MPNPSGTLWEEGRRYVLELELQNALFERERLDAVIGYLSRRLGIPAPGGAAGVVTART